MTDGPPVTVIDPRAEPPAPPDPGSRWSRAERAVALLTVVVLVVALAAARHLAGGTAGSGLTAVTTRHTLIGATPAVFRLELTVAGAAPDLLGVQAISADHGWLLEGSARDRLGDATALAFTHPVACDVPLRLPTRLRAESAGRPVTIPVRVAGIRPFRSGCDPRQGPEAVRVLTSTLTHGSRTRVRIGVVDLSTQPHTLSEVSFPGFSFAASTPLPLDLPGRDRSRPLSLADLSVQQLDLIADVSDCGLARPALDRAAASRTPDLMAAVVDGRAVRLNVPGLQAYLELRWHATCVR